MKRFSLVLCLFFVLFLFTGCLKRDSMEDIQIYTSVYPIEYITSRLYGNHSTIRSIYPDGIIPDKYELTDKQINDYSKSDLFIFTDLANEKQSIYNMLKSNNKLKIIDSTLGMEFNYGFEELWLDPSNLLMLSQNIKDGFNEYINNHYLKTEIDENYEKLKIDISNIAAKLHVVADEANDPTIIVSNDSFNFLESYGYKVISLEENDNLTDKTVQNVKNRILADKVNHIFIFQNEDVNQTIKKLMDETDVETIAFHSLSNISETERANKKDYLSIMADNISLLKQELSE